MERICGQSKWYAARQMRRHDQIERCQLVQRPGQVAGQVVVEKVNLREDRAGVEIEVLHVAALEEKIAQAQRQAGRKQYYERGMHAE